MISEENIDIFKRPKTSHIVHQCNLFHTFGAGIAKEIQKRYPEAYLIDRLTTKYGDLSRLGTYSYTMSKGKTIINLYSQVGIGSKDRQTDYDAMKKGFQSIREWLLTKQVQALAVPYKIGCGLANGDWNVVNKIITDAFTDAPFNVVICRKTDA